MPEKKTKPDTGENNIDERHQEIVELIKAGQQELETKVRQQIEEHIEKQGVPDAKLAEEIAEIKSTLEAYQTSFSEIRSQLTAQFHADAPERTITDEMKENEHVDLFLRHGWHKGHVVHIINGGIFNRPEYKAVITSGTVGSSTPGIVTPSRVRDYVPAAERRFTMRDIIPSSPVSTNAVEFPKENEFTNAASPQPFEGSPKAESSMTFTIETANVRTLAHWIPATSQILDDWPTLRRIIESKLMFGLKLVEEQQILSGDGTGQHLNGLITQATAFDMSRLNTGDTVLDFVRHAISQVEEADEESNFVVLNPLRFWEAMGIKDQASNVGNYVAGSPLGTNTPTVLWGKLLVVTNSIGNDTFLVGNRFMAEIFDRMVASITISTEHEEFFVKNLVAIKAEERIALAVYRAGAFVTGSFATAS